MNRLRKLVLGLLVAIGALLVIGMLLPRNVHVERMRLVAAPRDTVFPLVNGFDRFNEWSPWAGKDPAATYTFSGPRAGVGAKLSWTGNKAVGSGSQEVIAVVPPKKVVSRLDFGDGRAAIGTFLLDDDGPNTTVTWMLDADMGFGPFGRWFGLVLDRVVGPDFEQGLVNLKKVAEKR